MTLNSIETALTSTGIPVSYRSFSSPISAPYAVYCESRSEPIAGDTKTVARWGTYRVELYTSGKDLDAEAKVEAALNLLVSEYSKEETELADEKLLEIIYEFEGVEL